MFRFRSWIKWCFLASNGPTSLVFMKITLEIDLSYNGVNTSHSRETFVYMTYIVRTNQDSSERTKELLWCENIIHSIWEANSQETVGWYFWGVNIRSKNEYYMIEYLAGVEQSLPSQLYLIYGAFIVDQLGVLTWNEFYITRVQELGRGCTLFWRGSDPPSADWNWIEWTQGVFLQKKKELR